MVDAFATASDLGSRLKRTWSDDEKAWVTTLLEDASTYLRDEVIGQQVYPGAQSTFTEWPSQGRIDLPQHPVRSVDSVTRDGDSIDFEHRPGCIIVRGDDPCDVTFTWGYTSAPEDLNRLACVLVSGALLTLEQDIGLTAGGLSSVALDDFKIAWADAGAGSGMVLPPIQAAAVRRQFGRGDTIVVEPSR